ncbi:excalibur calcium-binding domain-containing protein [Nocardioides sp. Bht2]|uniref:excalibur calcium-binding domain-containing protein n=1 Tax=Nocardioides sp. Bht2 TaxID=3392297 RepID=UPI0039B66303
MRFHHLAVGLASAALAIGPLSMVQSAEAAMPKQFKNCTALQKVYPHGVGRNNAKDRTSGKPVTNFKRSTAIYNKAMSHNKRLDADKDGIACEKR